MEKKGVIHPTLIFILVIAVFLLVFFVVFKPLGVYEPTHVISQQTGTGVIYEGDDVEIITGWEGQEARGCGPTFTRSAVRWRIDDEIVNGWQDINFCRSVPLGPCPHTTILGCWDCIPCGYLMHNDRIINVPLSVGVHHLQVGYNYECGSPDICSDWNDIPHIKAGPNNIIDIDFVVLPMECVPDYQCTDWTDCIDGKQTRTCNDINNCNMLCFDKPECIEERDCTIEEYCGDGICNPGANEDCGSCPEDCGVCEPEPSPEPSPGEPKGPTILEPEYFEEPEGKETLIALAFLVIGLIALFITKSPYTIILIIAGGLWLLLNIFGTYVL